MFLNALFHYIYTSEFEALEDNEEYQVTKTAYAATEKELIFSMTKKQRRMFHECMQQRNELATMEIRRLLSRYAILIPPKQ